MDFGMIIHTYANTNPVVPAGHPFAGEFIFNCPPLADPNAGLPLAQLWPLLPPLPGHPHGCIDLLQLIPVGTTLNSVGVAGNLARFISCGGASNGVLRHNHARTKTTFPHSTHIMSPLIQVPLPTASLGGTSTRRCQRVSGRPCFGIPQRAPR